MSGAVLVTGGAGYIGSHVSKALADFGPDAGLLRHTGEGSRVGRAWGPLERGDIGDAARLDEVFARHKPRAIIHMAGYAEVGELFRQPERYMRNNVTKTGVLVEAALRHGIEAFVFSSSCSVYGLPQSDLLDEKHPIAPMSPYSELKARAEVLLASCSNAWAARGVAALFQCRGCRRRGRYRRSARAGNPSAAACSRCGARPRSAAHLAGRRLSDARWLVRARLCPRDRFGRRACPRT